MRSSGAIQTFTDDPENRVRDEEHKKQDCRQHINVSRQPLFHFNVLSVTSCTRFKPSAGVTVPEATPARTLSSSCPISGCAIRWFSACGRSEINRLYISLMLGVISPCGSNPVNDGKSLRSFNASCNASPFTREARNFQASGFFSPFLVRP